MTREQKLTRFNGVAIAAFGLIFAAGAWTPIYDLVAYYIHAAHWPYHAAPKVAGPTERLLIATTGGLSVSLGVAIWTAAGVVWEASPDAARRLIRYTAWTWFIVDSSFSIVAGSPMNAALNLVFLTMILLPIRRSAATRSATA
ncbi:MAG: hypothetical protein AAGA47_04505 [Pseudomonadota bacterium]